MKMKIIFTTFFFLLVQTGFSYPTRYWTLKEMTELSKVVVIAKVDSHFYEKEQSLSLLSQKTKLIFNEYIFGDSIKGEVFIEYIAGTSCPKPINLKEGSSIMLFIHNFRLDSLGRKDIEFIGLKKFDGDDYKLALKKAVLNLKEIHRIKNKRKEKRQTTKWLMECIQDENLKFDATIDLARNINFLERFSFYSEPDNYSNYYKFLNRKQKSLLKALIINADSFTVSEFNMIRIIGKRNKKEIRKILIAKISVADRYLTDDMMSAIITLESNSNLKTAYHDYHSYLFDLNNLDNNNESQVLELKKQIFIELAE